MNEQYSEEEETKAPQKKMKKEPNRETKPKPTKIAPTPEQKPKPTKKEPKQETMSAKSEPKLKSKKVDWFEIRCLRNKSFNQIDGKRILRNNGHNQNSANVTLKEGRRKEGRSFSEN